MARRGDPRSAGGAATATTGWIDEILQDDRSRSRGRPQADENVITGHLAGVDDEGRVLFLEEGGAGAPVPVAIGLAISDGALVRAARHAQRALVVRTGGATPRLVLTGLVRERVAAEARDAAPGHLEVSVDGETVVLSADRRIELRCGKSSLILTREGRVVLKGAHVVSRSSGPNKLKGATIALN